MGYYFECDACGYRVSISDQDMNPFYHHASCAECGQDGCSECLENGLCYDCEEDLDEELANDE